MDARMARAQDALERPTYKSDIVIAASQLGSQSLPELQSLCNTCSV